jgi:uncharacterized protein YdaU (DUF1376 family)
MIGHNSASYGQEIDPPVETILGDDHKKLFHYVQWNLADYITGTQGMTPEQEGVYMRFLVRLYDRGKPLPDDDRFMSSIMGLDIRRWRRARTDLVAFGKIIVRAGALTNARFEKERLKRAEELQKQAEATRKYWEKRRAEKATSEESRAEVGAKSAGLHRDVSEKFDEKPNKINETDEHPNRHTRKSRVQSLEERKEDISPNGDLASEAKPGDSRKLKAAEAARMAFDSYNALAERIGLPIANVLTDTRKQKIVARIRDAGGMTAFEKALSNIEKSAFLRGNNDSGFRADFDFICQAKSFSRLMDGGYGNGLHAKVKPKTTDDVWFENLCREEGL